MALLKTLSPPSLNAREIALGSAGLLIGAMSCVVGGKYSFVLAGAAAAAPILWFAFRVPGAWITCFLVCAALLPPLPISLGDSGPHTAVLFGVVGLLSVAARTISWRAPASALNIAILCWWGSLALSIGPAILSAGPAIALGSATRVALCGIALLVFFAAQGPDCLTSEQAHRTVRLLFTVAVIAAAFACVDFRLQLPAPAGYGPQFVWLDSGVYRRAQGFFYEASTLGNFCAFFLLMAAVSFLEPRTRRIIHRKWLAIGTVVLLSALVASYSRASLVNVGVGLFVLACIEWRRWFRIRRLAAIVGTILLTLLVLWYVAPEFAPGYSARLSFSISDMVSRPDRVLSGRLSNWEILSGFILEHPLQAVVGVGYKTLAYSDHLGTPLIADNAYLSALVETGIAGLVALILLNIVVLRVAWRSAKGPDPFFGRWILCFWAGESIQMLSGDILTYWRVLPFYLWVLAQAVNRIEA